MHLGTEALSYRHGSPPEASVAKVTDIVKKLVKISVACKATQIFKEVEYQKIAVTPVDAGV